MLVLPMANIVLLPGGVGRAPARVVQAGRHSCVILLLNYYGTSAQPGLMVGINACVVCGTARTSGYVQGLWIMGGCLVGAWCHFLAPAGFVVGATDVEAVFYAPGGQIRLPQGGNEGEEIVSPGRCIRVACRGTPPVCMALRTYTKRQERLDDCNKARVASLTEAYCKHTTAGSTTLSRAPQDRRCSARSVHSFGPWHVAVLWWSAGSCVPHSSNPYEMPASET